MVRRRAPLYDTRSYTLEGKDLPQGLIFSIITLGLAVLATYNTAQAITWWAAAAIVCYLSVLFSSNRTRLFAPIILSIALAFPLLWSINLLRLIIFSTAIALIPRKRDSVGSLLVLITLWALFLNSAQIAHLAKKTWIPIGATDIKLAIFEITGFLVLLILLWTKPFPALFGRISREVEISTIGFVLFLLASLIGAALAFTGALALVGKDFESIASLEHNASALSIMTVALITIPLLLASSLNKLIRDFALKLEQSFVAPGNSVPISLNPKVVEFQQVLSRARELLDDHELRVRETELNSKAVLAQRDEKQKELKDLVSDANNITTIMSLSPEGVMAISGAGAILLDNVTIEAQFGLRHFESCIGLHYHDLQPDHNSSESELRRSGVLFQFLNRILAEQKSLPRGQALRSFATIDDKFYAQFTAYIFDERVLPVEWKRMSPKVAPSDITVAIFASVREDNRGFFLRQLYPSTLEVLAGQCIETLNDLSQSLTAVEDSVKAAEDELQGPRRLSADELEAKLRSFIRSVRETYVDMRSILLDQQKRNESDLNVSEPDKRPVLEKVDVCNKIEGGLRIFEELHGLNIEINLSFPHGANPEGENVRLPCEVNVVPSQFTQFMGRFLSVISGIFAELPTVELSIAVGTEQIGMSTAALFRGSHAGKYSRIVISHPGQSVTSQMLPNSMLRLSTQDKASSGLDAALMLLALEIDRMRGFFAVQSSPAKGTHLTIYLPEDPFSVMKAQKSSRRRVPSSKIDTGDSSELARVIAETREMINPAKKQDAMDLETRRLLLIEDDPEVISEIKTQFVGADSRLEILEISRVEAKKIASPVNFSGSGFGGATKTDDLFDRSVDLNSFSLIVVPILGELSEGIRLLRALGEDRRILVIAKDPDSADALSALHPVLNYPLDNNSLLAVLNQVFGEV